jgi:NADH-quinone oxidoreductase subunit C
MTTEDTTGKQSESQLEPGQFGQFLSDFGIPSTRLPDSSGVETIEVPPARLEAALKRLRNSPESRLNFLVCVAGMESSDTFDSVYQLGSFHDPEKELIVKVRIPKSAVPAGRLPLVPSIANSWPTANWHEREAYDLAGIKYTGHPYLRRILNPWDWEGHPLRHDYKQPVDALNNKNPESMR